MTTYDPATGPRADLGGIGGSGLYSLLDGEQVEVETPFGPPSDPLTIAQVGDRRAAFVPPHGRAPPAGAGPAGPLWSPATAGTTGSRRTSSTTGRTSGH